MELKVDSSKFKDEVMEKIEELSGQNIFACYLCGKCSAGCPVVDKMDILPHQIMRYLQLGAYEIVLNSKTIWLCASCFTCGVRCPKGVDIAKVNEALRLIVLRESKDYIDISEISQKDLEELPPIALVSNFRKYTT
ncbi:MAG: 4Fe-4S dicluster domain-containing protein [Candidatus Odinarchaeota archaeon]|nr:4Fe-4S dicluster domain-containing protein [Candidatus Odinarchaeota archaeon]